MKKHIIGLGVVSLIIFGPVAFSQSRVLVFPGAGGRLEYVPFANVGETNIVNTIPDFSFAGYKRGGVPLPIVPVRVEISPDTGDMRSRIQEAINTVSSLPLGSDGFRGAVLLKKGLYRISDSLVIKTGGVVLRGQGQNSAGNGGTELLSTSTTPVTLIQIKGEEKEQSSGFVLDTKDVPSQNTWIGFDVTSGVQQELRGDRIISFQIVSHANDYVAYDSRENSHKPLLEVRTKVDTNAILIGLNPVADTYVRGSATYADSNYGGDLNLAVKNAGNNNSVTREIFLRFDVTTVQGEITSSCM